MRILVSAIAALLFSSVVWADQPGFEAGGDAASAVAAQPVDFAHDIVPLLKTHCSKCHLGRKQEGDLSMNTRESLLKAKVAVTGKSGESTLIARVSSNDPDERMPPEGDALAAEQVDLLRRWIDEGLPWQNGFSFAGKKKSSLPLALTSPNIPPPVNGHSHPIDRIVEAYFAKHNVAFPPPVDDAAFARRAYLDLIGLLPTPEQLEVFLADGDPDKRTRLIDELLSNDRAYTEHWFTFWCDLLRNDYAGTGYIDGGRKQITGWLYDALLENKPYDQFVRELIAPTPESEGFIKGIKWRGNVNASQAVEMQFSQNVAQVFLGINLKCASCHDSFVDDWKLADAYGLAAITAEKPLEIHRCDLPQWETATPAFLFNELGGIDGDKPRNERLVQLATRITDPRNGRLPRTLANRVWHRLLGHGIVHPVDAMDADPWSADLLDHLAGALVASDNDVKALLRHIVTSQIYQARCVEPADSNGGDGPAFRGPIARRMTAEQYIDAVWRITDTAPSKLAGKFGDRGDEPVRASLVASNLLMRSLGRPNREQVVTTRPEELSTLEALDLTNGQIMADYVEKGASRILKQHPQRSADDTIDWLYQATLCRRPTNDELATARETVGNPTNENGLADLLWCVFVLPEFQVIK